MTFTEFLSSPRRKKTEPSFLNLARHDALWPAQSNRLEDFESFLIFRLEDEADDVVTELRDLWRDFARAVPEGKHELDLALAAWGDYARHLRTCEGTELAQCETAEELLEKAISESDLEDLDNPHRDPASCEGTEDRELEEEVSGERWPDLDEDDEWEETDPDDEDDWDDEDDQVNDNF